MEMQDSRAPPSTPFAPAQRSHGCGDQEDNSAPPSRPLAPAKGAHRFADEDNRATASNTFSPAECHPDFSDEDGRAPPSNPLAPAERVPGVLHKDSRASPSKPFAPAEHIRDSSDEDSRTLPASPEYVPDFSDEASKEIPMEAQDTADPYALAELICDISDEERSSRRDELFQWCLKALSPRAAVLLNEVRLPLETKKEMIVNLVGECIFSEESLARHVCSPGSKCHPELLQLKPKLELVYALDVAEESLSSESVEALHNWAETTEELRAISLADLDSLLEPLNESAQKAIRALHTKGHALREKASELGVDAKMVKFLEKQQYGDVSRFDDAQVQHLLDVFQRENPTEKSLPLRKLLRNMMDTVLEGGTFGSNEDLVEHVSKGRWRYGSKGYGCELEGTMLPLLEQPECVKLIGPPSSIAAASKYIVFFQKDAFSRFFRFADNAGLDSAVRAVSLQDGACFKSIQAAKSSGVVLNGVAHSSCFACMVEVQYIPVQSFCIEPDCVVLSNEAEEQLNGLANSQGALEVYRLDQFFSTFGDVVPQNEQTLGGIWFTLLQLQLDEGQSCKPSVLCDQLLRLWEAMSDEDLKTPGILKPGTLQDGEKMLHYDQQIQVHKLGPQGPSTIEAFKLELESNPDEWHLISRGDRKSSLPVWKFIAEFWKSPAQRDHVAERLHDVWLNQVSHCGGKLSDSELQLLRPSLKRQKSDPHSSLREAVQYVLQEHMQVWDVKGAGHWEAEDLNVELFGSFLKALVHVQKQDTTQPVLQWAFQDKDFKSWLNSTAKKHIAVLLHKVIGEKARQEILRLLDCSDLNKVLESLQDDLSQIANLLVELDISDLPSRLIHLSTGGSGRAIHEAEQCINATFRGLRKNVERCSHKNLKNMWLQISQKLEQVLSVFGYGGAELGSFFDDLSSESLKALGDQLSRVFCLRFVPGDCVERRCPHDEIKWLESLPSSPSSSHLDLVAVGEVITVHHQTIVEVKWSHLVLSGHGQVELPKDCPGQQPVGTWELRFMKQETNPSNQQIQWQCEHFPPLQILGDQGFEIGSAQLVDCLRWRTDPKVWPSRSHACQVEDEWSWEPDGNNDSFHGGTEEPDDELERMQAWCDVLQKAELIDVVSVFDMLLEQRKPIPLYWESNDGIEVSKLEAMQYVQGTGFQTTHKKIDLFKSEIPCVAYSWDSRVKSPHGASLANKHFSTHFEDRSDLKTMVEMALGFTKSPTGVEHYLILLVRGQGDKPLPAWVFERATTALFEVSDLTTQVPEGLGKKAWRYCVTDSRRPVRDRLFAGTFVDLGKLSDPNTLKKLLGDEAPIAFEQLVECQPASEGKELRNTLKKLEKLDVTVLREKLCMQDIFADEQVKRGELRRCKPGTQEGVLQSQVAELVRQRKEKAWESSRCKPLQLVETALRKETRSDRMLCISLIGEKLESMSEAQIVQPRMKKEAAHEALINASTDAERHQCRKEFAEAADEYARASLSLSNVFRELGHIYVAQKDSMSNSSYPKLFARHMLDGGAVEFMDGEAGAVNRAWVKAILEELDRLLYQNLGRKARITVRSVLGRQSCGKSTVLNVMYGTSLRSSAGICTRGVNMFLVPCFRANAPYDFILGLDTEGICSPNFMGRLDYDEKNNIMAMIALLHADTCLLVAEGEGLQEFADILPIVMLAYHSSRIASRFQDQMVTQMFFLHNKVASKEAGGHSYREASTRLKQKLVEEEGMSQGQEASKSTSFMHNLDIEKDIQYGGPLNKGEHGPETSFGETLAKLNDRMFEKLTADRKFTPLHLDTFIDRMMHVLDCAGHAERYAKFQQSAKYRLKKRLNKRLNEFRVEVQIQLEKVHEKHVTDLLASVGAANRKDEENWPGIFAQSSCDLSEAAKVITDKVDDLLQDDDFCEFAADLKSDWDSDVKNEIQRQNELLRSVWEVQFSLSPKVQECQEKIRETLLAVRSSDSGRLSQCTTKDLEHEFDRVLLEIVNVETDIVPAVQVGSQIDNDYAQNCRDYSRFHRRSAWGADFTVHVPPKDRTCSLFGLAPYESKVLDIGAMVERAELCRKYEQSAVLQIIRQTDGILNKYKVSDRQKRRSFHLHVKDTITNILKKKQSEYDQEHDLKAALMAKRPTMLKEFELMVKGVEGIVCIKEVLEAALKEALNGCFTDIICQKTKARLIQQPWATDFEAAFAAALLPLVQKFRSGRKREVVQGLTKPGLLETRMTQLCENLVDKQASLLELKQCIKSALQVAKFSFLSNTSVSGATAWKGPVSELKKRLPPAMQPRLPDVVGMLENLEGTDDKFKFGSDVPGAAEVFDQVAKAVEAWNAPEFSCTGEDLYSRLTSAAMSDAFKPRCTERCFWCKMYCLKPDKHQGRCDTMHQPQGLAGITCPDTNTLTYETCAECVERNYDMHGLGQFKDFTKFFPKWETPGKHTAQHKFQEFVFCNCQWELRHLYSAQRCQDIPRQWFEHSLQDIEDRLQKQAGGVT